MRTSSISLVASAFLLGSMPTLAQSTLEAPVGGLTPYTVDSGEWNNPNAEAITVFEQGIHVPNAAWIRVYFDAAQLPVGSFIRVTSMLDGEVQQLDATGLATWGNTTAYFNGDLLSLELVAGAGTNSNRIAIREVSFESQIDQSGSGNTRGGTGQCGICGTDDRVPSTENWSCRLMPIGCTASVYTTASCLVSAGHCITANLVAQFNVPASNANCNVMNPPVADQFPVTSTQQINMGVGADWSVLRTGANSSGQRPFQRYGQLRRIAPVLANVNDLCGFWGYGLDTNCVRSQTQQSSSGSITARTSNSYQFNADVRGGNSGSGLISNGRIIGIVTHCQVGCPNHGTRSDVAAFVAARGSLCPACLADVNGDGVVDLVDLTNELAAFGTTYPNANFNPAYDLNGDNVVDLADLTLMLGGFGSTCP